MVTTGAAGAVAGVGVGVARGCTTGISALGGAWRVANGGAGIGAGTGELRIRFIRRTDQIDGDGIYVTNYESVRDGKLDVAGFTAVRPDRVIMSR